MLDGLVLLCINWCRFITELWPLNHVRILFLLHITRMNGWNWTNYFINVGILTCYKTSLDFVNTSELVISGRLFLSYNGPGRGHLCHTDTFLVLFFRIKRLENHHMPFLCTHSSQGGTLLRLFLICRAFFSLLSVKYRKCAAGYLSFY